MSQKTKCDELGIEEFVGTSPGTVVALKSVVQGTGGAAAEEREVGPLARRGLPHYPDIFPTKQEILCALYERTRRLTYF